MAPPSNHPNSVIVSNTTTNKRKTCKIVGCNRAVKAQGLCQRHGARTKLCRSVGCHKQAQGGAGGYCKFHFRNKELATSSILECSSAGTLTEVSPNTINMNCLKMEYNTLNEQEPYIRNKNQDKIFESLQSPASIDTQCTNDMDSGYVQQLPTDRQRNNQQPSYNIPSAAENKTPLEQWEIDFILGESQLEQWEIDLISNESQVINEQDSHYPLSHLSNVRGNEYEFPIGSLREYSSYDTTGNYSDVTVATYENQPTYDYEDSHESIDSGYIAFLAEFMENITQPWLDEPDISEI